jgi:ribosomal protein S6--L-glutamate ligase
MRIGILGNPESWYVHDLTRAANDRGVRADRIDYHLLTCGIRDGRPAIAAGELDLRRLDAVIVRTMPPGSLEQVVFRMDALARLEAEGLTILNPPRAIEHAVDKYLATAKLAADGLPVPDTIVCENSEAALVAFEQLGGDVVIKPVFGAEGRGIVRVSDPDIALRVFRTLERIQAVLYLQRFIAHPGYDLRVLVLNGEPIGAMRRFAQSGFKTNIACQGRGEPYTPTAAELDLALRSTATIGATFCGVDLLTGPHGEPYVIEVNGVPGWRGFQAATGIDVAARVLDWLRGRSR